MVSFRIMSNFLFCRLINAVAVLKSFPSAVNENEMKELAELAGNEIEMIVTNNNNEEDFEHLTNVFSDSEKGAQSDNHSLQRDNLADQATDLLVRLEFHKVRIHLSVTQESGAARPVANFTMECLKAELIKQPLNTIVDLKLKDISMVFMDFLDDRARSIPMVTSKSGSANQELLSMRYTETEMSAFNLTTSKQAVLKKVEVDFASMIVTFHQEAVIDLLQLSNRLQSQIEAIGEKTRVRCLNTNETDLEISPARILASEGIVIYLISILLTVIELNYSI